MLGADLAYLRTRFIATNESLAGDDYRSAVVTATLDDVQLSTQVGGMPASLLSSSLAANRGSDATASRGFEQDRLIRNRTAWSAGHSVSGVEGITSVAVLVGTIREQYDGARGTLQGQADGWAASTVQRPD